MSDEKKLHWFKFSPQDWQNGDITLESYDVQGVFINVCAYYWIKECSITLALLKKRFNGSSDSVDHLIKLGIIEHCEISDFITIHFLNRQFDELSNARKLRQEAGRKGGLSKAKAMLEQSSSDPLALREEEIRVEQKRTEEIRVEKKKKPAPTFEELINLFKHHYRQVWGEFNKMHQSELEKENPDENLIYKLKKAAANIKPLVDFVESNELDLIAKMNGQLTAKNFIDNEPYLNLDNLTRLLAKIDNSETVRKRKNPHLHKTLITWIKEGY